jgi:hypothetical protein
MTDIQAIRERVEKATKGPWYTVGSPWLPSDTETYVIAGSPDPHAAKMVCEPIMPDSFTGEDDADLEAQEAAALSQCDADMDFIAHARTDIPFLLSEIDRLNAVSARVKELEAALAKDAKTFDNLANILDGWALDSRKGGWSTHQVSANTTQAGYCRRDAARIRKALQEQPKK